MFKTKFQLYKYIQITLKLYIWIQSAMFADISEIPTKTGVIIALKQQAVHVAVTI